MKKIPEKNKAFHQKLEKAKKNKQITSGREARRGKKQKRNETN